MMEEMDLCLMTFQSEAKQDRDAIKSEINRMILEESWKILDYDFVSSSWVLFGKDCETVY